MCDNFHFYSNHSQSTQIDYPPSSTYSNNNIIANNDVDNNNCMHTCRNSQTFYLNDSPNINFNNNNNNNDSFGLFLTQSQMSSQSFLHGPQPPHSQSRILLSPQQPQPQNFFPSLSQITQQPTEFAILNSQVNQGPNSPNHHQMTDLFNRMSQLENVINQNNQKQVQYSSTEQSIAI
jgi:hypothetical protein